ncbi:MAG TPA: hypothetical protein VHS59_08165 [Bacillota bacterium]|nr:hypothetical protein [Bacillota bacterium]
MNRKNFLQGLLAGGLVGALVGIAATPQRKPEPGPSLLSRTTKAGFRAQKMIKEIRRGLVDIKNILD